MPRRPSEISIRPTLTAPEKPEIPGAAATVEREGRALTPLAPRPIPIEPEQEQAFLARFDAWRSQTNGSLPEFIVWEFLVKDKKQIPGFDFIFQHPVLGGRTRFGGYILDFFFNLRQEGWRVQGERFHLEKPSDRARDQIARQQLSNRGLHIIDLWEDDLISRPLFVLNAAWERGASVISRAPFSNRGF